MRYFDTHAHLGLITEDPIDQLIVVQEARQEGVQHLVTVSNNLIDFAQLFANLKTETNVYHSIGISPSSVVQPGDDWEAKIQEGTRLERVVAIGEIGLDYYRKFGDRDSQVELFIRQLELAEKLSLPVIIHNRDAGSDVLEILRERLPRRGGILHCYSEDYEYAKKALELNLWISFAGNVTYRNARNLQDTARKIPVERMLIESEAPFMVPAVHRGKRNKPSYINETAAFIAQLREVPVEAITETLYANSLAFFGLHD
ncbi:MAG TPA: TatD family hydrolase [Spirochaetia bacterium]|nr:TatD family hydrolase [Spirochaetia bacterium]